MRSVKHQDQQNQERLRSFIHLRYAIRYRPLQENVKKTAWTVWRVYPEITEKFNELSVNTDTIGAEDDVVTERFSVL